MIALAEIKGRWKPAIPLPFFGIRFKCMKCKRKFNTREGYNTHYTYKHIYLEE